MEDFMSAKLVPEPYCDFGDFGRETPVRPNQVRVDRVNVLAMRYVTRQPEPIRIVGQRKGGAGRQVKQ
jgi:hypothetical protein